MSENLSQIESIFKDRLGINSNNDDFQTCYEKCANKDKVVGLFSQRNHEMIFGRRGTGKTTLLKALKFYTNHVNTKPIFSIYVDMEDIVPNEIEFINEEDDSIVIETYRNLMSHIIEQLIELGDEIIEKKKFRTLSYSKNEIAKIDKSMLKLLDLVENGNQKTINKHGTREVVNASEKGYTGALSATLRRDAILFGRLGIFKKKHKINTIATSENFTYVLNIQSIRNELSTVIGLLKIERIIICIDEFTRVDKGMKETIQPKVAQLIKDTLFRIGKISVKLSSLWHKTKSQRRQIGGIRDGIELGEDIKCNLDLDTMFFEDSYNQVFFKNMLTNLYVMNQQIKASDSISDFILDSLFNNKDVFMLLICGSQGVPRIFGNLLISAIELRIARQKSKIDAEIAYECIVKDYSVNVRRRLPNENELVKKFDSFISDKKSRFVLIAFDEYQQNVDKINSLVDCCFIHQYPSETVDRNLRNAYKVFLVHYGNYIEALGIKEWRKTIEKGPSIYPTIPKQVTNNPMDYQLLLCE